MQMNGDVSASMRKYGYDYKLNFGLMIAQIKALSTRYAPNCELAELLWNENTRELKILATMLFPPQACTVEKARLWQKQITNQEIREQLIVNLFQHLPNALMLVIEWGKEPDPSSRITGYMLLTRLLITRKIETGENIEPLLTACCTDTLSDNLLLRQSALLALKRWGRQFPLAQADILKFFRSRDFSTNQALLQQIEEDLTFEFDFFSSSVHHKE